LVATADSHYPGPEKWRAREMYKRIRPGGFTNMDEFPTSVDDLKCELFPKNAEQMFEEYEKYKDEYDFYDEQAVIDAIERSHDIAWNFIEDIEPKTKIQYPSFVCPADRKPIDVLREKSEEGLKKKGLHRKPDYIARLDYELGVIEKKDFSLYFLTMKEIIDTLSDHMLIGPGRGSGAGSLLCYCLNITKIDPIKYKLLFERFLNETRSDAPDIDTDVSDKDLAFKILQQKYGEDNVIAISNINTLGFKSLIKDLACKFFNIPYEEVNHAVKFVDVDIKKGCKATETEYSPKMLNLEYAKKFSPPFLEFIEKYPELESYIADLGGEQKSIGRHAGGILIADNIGTKMPVITSKKVRQTPWNKKYLEELGWLKFDLLGLETLKIIENCISLILKRHHGIADPTFKDINKWYDEHLLPETMDLEDQNVFKHIYKDGYYAGIFQATNKDTQKFFSAAEPKSVEDISDLTALYRPGPMAIDAHWDYIEKKHGRKQIVFNHEIEKEFLEDTAGIVCYQEQMMFMMNKIGGLSLVETDTFRKVVSKKPVKGDPLYDQMLQYRDKFIEGAVSKNIEKKTSVGIWDAMEAFAGYAFNRSHSTCYAYISYMTSWLCTYFEPEWLCAYVETQLDKPAEKAKAIAELRKFGYDFNKIDINLMDINWTIIDNEKKLVPSGLSCKGIGEKAIDEIKSLRPYKSIYDFLWNGDGTFKHSKCNKKNVSALIRIEGFDSLRCVGENKLFKNYAHMYRAILDEKNWEFLKKKLKKDTYETQIHKLEQLALNANDQDWSIEEKLAMSIELLGQPNIDLIIPKKTQDKLINKGYSSINEFDDDEERSLVWFIVSDFIKKKTKYDTPFYILFVYGSVGREEKVFLWEPLEGFELKKNHGYVGLIERNQYGLSTKCRYIKELKNNNAE